jgi:hypothetical protein
MVSTEIVSYPATLNSGEPGIVNPDVGDGMNIEINTVLQSGTVQWPSLKYDAQGRPEFRFTLYREAQSADGKMIPFSFPCCAVGSTAERLAGEVDEGHHILISVGELCYRKRQTQKHGELSRLEILCWRLQILDRASVPVAARSGSGEYASQGEPAIVAPEPKVRKPRYPKWHPEHAN